MPIPAATATPPPTVPPELLAPPSAQERRRLDRDLCTPLLDGWLGRLARQDSLCRRVLGRLAAAFLARRAHLRLGFVRVADYARERIGLSGRELEELARVGRGLEGLPAIAGAFEQGELSWSHVRLLVAVATGETEAEWLARARGRSVRGLRAAIGGRAAADADDPDAIDGEARTRFRLRCPRRVRRQWAEATELASRLCGMGLPAWRAAETIAAEGLSGLEGGVAAEPVGEERGGRSAVAADAPSDAIPWEAVAAAIPEEVESLAWMAESLDPFALDGRLRQVVRALQRLDWQTGRLLALVAGLRLYRAFGCQTLRDYVEGRLGFSLRRARALLALDRVAQRCPELLAAYQAGRLSLARALVLLPVLQPETAAAWVARATEVTLRRLEDSVSFAIEAAAPGAAVLPPPAEGRLELPPLAPGAEACAGTHQLQECARACDAEIAFAGPATVVGLLWAVVRACTTRGEPAWRGLERLLAHVTAQWAAQPRVRDPIFARDGWRCAVPACSARASLHDHHVVYRSRGGDHRRENRVAICAAHHLQGIHRMRLRVTGQAPDDLTWEIGWRRGRPPLLRTHGDRYLDAGAA
jgi:hypothetical protein